MRGGGEARNYGNKPLGKRSFGRPRRRWEGNFKMELREVGYEVDEPGSIRGVLKKPNFCYKDFIAQFTTF
jgi:hypothetical protein